MDDLLATTEPVRFVYAGLVFSTPAVNAIPAATKHIDLIVPCAGLDPVSAARRNDGIVTATPNRQISTRVVEQEVITGGAFEQIPAGPAGEYVRPGTTEKGVASGSAINERLPSVGLNMNPVVTAAGFYDRLAAPDRELSIRISVGVELDSFVASARPDRDCLGPRAQVQGYRPPDPDVDLKLG